jgi:hypothetical protein
MGQTQVQDADAAQAAQRGMACQGEERLSRYFRPLACSSRTRLDNKSRVNREIYARFCEGFGVQFPGPTRHRDGFAIWAKRLEEGTYAIPVAESPEERRREITAQEFGAILSGIDLKQAGRRKRYQRPV